MANEVIFEARHMHKAFGPTIALKDVDFQLRRGEIHALLGENGGGKTTLMNMLSGIYFPDEGDIFINDRKVVIRSPKDAFNHGIGMIHQHFKLVDVFTVLDNIILGAETTKMGFLQKRAAREKVKALSEKYGLKDLKDMISFGASPRASINLALAARAYAFIKRRGYVIPEDVRAVCHDVLRHRIGLTYEAEAENITTEQIITDILNNVIVP